MSRAAWAAIIAAIAFPSIALVVVLLARPGMPPGPPPLPRGELGPRRGPPPLQDEMLIRLRKQLELTDEQVERIWKIGQPARRRMAELEVSIGEKEHELGTLLASDDVGEQEALSTLEELHALHLDVEKLRLLTPLRLRAVLTPEQRSKLVDLWHERAGEGPGRPPPMPPDRFGPHPGKGPPGPPGYPPYGPPGKGPPGPFGAPPPGPFDNGGTPLPYEPR